MPTYELTVEIDSMGLKTFNEADQLVTIVKSVGAGSGQPVAWVSFYPGQSNVVTWTENYSVYSSTTQIMDGAQIQTQSTQPAVGGNMYTLSGGQFDNGKPGLQPTTYGVDNEDSNFKINGVALVTAGLYQGAVVNGTNTASPLNAVGVPFTEKGWFTPIEKIQVFASSYQNNGLIISSVSSDALSVDLTQQPSQIIHYNDANNRFALGPLAGDRSVRRAPAR